MMQSKNYVKYLNNITIFECIVKKINDIVSMFFIKDIEKIVMDYVLDCHYTILFDVEFKKISGELRPSMLPSEIGIIAHEQQDIKSMKLNNKGSSADIIISTYCNKLLLRYSSQEIYIFDEKDHMNITLLRFQTPIYFCCMIDDDTLVVNMNLCKKIKILYTVSIKTMCTKKVFEYKYQLRAIQYYNNYIYLIQQTIENGDYKTIITILNKNFSIDKELILENKYAIDRLFDKCSIGNHLIYVKYVCSDIYHAYNINSGKYMMTMKSSPCLIACGKKYIYGLIQGNKIIEMNSNYRIRKYMNFPNKLYFTNIVCTDNFLYATADKILFVPIQTF